MELNEVKIVADSSSDIVKMNKVAFSSAALKIITSNKEYIDNDELNVEAMIDDLEKNKEKITTACPSTADWLDAFNGGKYIFCITITSNLSGAYNSALLAKKEYLEKNPEAKVYVIDSLSTGPECKLIAEKLEELIVSGKDFEEISAEINEYKKNTHLLFMLESVKNLKNNGRVSPLLAKIIGVLGIRLVGKASDEGTLEVLSKVRGENHSIGTIISHMKAHNFNGGKVRISHCRNESYALKLKEKILETYKNTEIEIYKAKALCSFYAENGGLLIGFEG